MSQNAELRTKYDQLIKSKPVVVFMKGSPDFPMCGFSAQVIEILKSQGVQKDQLAHLDILEDETMRVAAKEFSNWPTFPQVFVGGEFVGGCDILTDLNENGELKAMLSKA